MAAKSCDDPMDLGPFLQNYVMKNPFSESSLLVASSSPLPSSSSADEQSGTLIPEKDLTESGDCSVQSAKRPRTVAEMLCKVRSDNSEGEAVKSKNSLTAAGLSTPLRRIRPRVESNGVLASEQSRVVGKKLGGKNGSVQARIASTKAGVDKNGTVSVKHSIMAKPFHVATAKRSVVMLSNHDEMMDKYGNSTNVDRLQIESWMRDNYRYLHGNRRLTVSTQHLLLRSQQFFSSVTGELIDDIVRCLYPKCEKMPKRHGSVYVGLVARPEPDILDNPVFMTALESVISGVLPVRCAAEKFGIRETSLVSAVMWTSIEPRSGNEGGCENEAFDRILQSELERVSNLSEASNRSFVKGRRVKRPATKDCTIGDDVPDSRTPEHQRFKSDNDDNFDLEMMMLQDTQSTSSPADSAERTPSRLSISGHVVGETIPASPSCFEHIEIKSEPVDEDSPIEVRSHGDESPVHRSTSAYNSEDQLDNRTDLNDISDRPSHSAGRLDSSAALLSSHVSNDASWLRAELAVAQKSNLALREELNTRDFHIAQLAEDFFQLQEQFRKLSRRFQRALTDVNTRQSDSDEFVVGDS